MKKISNKKLNFEMTKLRELTSEQLQQVAGGLTGYCNPTNGYTVCVCITDYGYSCPCADTIHCKP